MLTEMWVRLGWFAAGATAGAVAGWSLNAAQDSRRVRQMGDRFMRTDRGSATANIAAVVCVVIVATSALLAANAVRASSQASTRTRVLAGCSSMLLAHTIEALNERGTYADEAAAATRSVREAQAAFVATRLTPDSAAQQRRILEKYGDAIAASILVAQKQDARRMEFPYPTPAQITSCYGATLRKETQP